MTQASKDWEFAALNEVITSAGLPVDDEWQHLGTSHSRAAFRNSAQGLFVRVSPLSELERTEVEVVFARWADERGLSTLGLAPNVREQPVIGHSSVATIWPTARAMGPDEVDPRWLGETLARIHHSVAPLPIVPRWEPRPLIISGLALLRRFDADAALVSQLQRKAMRILDSITPLRTAFVPVHGDAFLDNVVDDDGQSRLIDFESARIGPAMYDLAPLFVLSRRFGRPMTAASEMTTSYGEFDQVSLRAMIDLLELRIICGTIVPYVGRLASFREELVTRVESLGDDGHGLWTPHRVLLSRD